jgi:hypothetical protein
MIGYCLQYRSSSLDYGTVIRRRSSPDAYDDTNRRLQRNTFGGITTLTQGMAMNRFVCSRLWTRPVSNPASEELPRLCRAPQSPVAVSVVRASACTVLPWRGRDLLLPSAKAVPIHAALLR